MLAGKVLCADDDCSITIIQITMQPVHPRGIAFVDHDAPMGGGVGRIGEGTVYETLQADKVAGIEGFRDRGKHLGRIMRQRPSEPALLDALGHCEALTLDESVVLQILRLQVVVEHCGKRECGIRCLKRIKAAHRISDLIGIAHFGMGEQFVGLVRRLTGAGRSSMIRLELGRAQPGRPSSTYR